MLCHSEILQCWSQDPKLNLGSGRCAPARANHRALGICRRQVGGGRALRPAEAGDQRFMEGRPTRLMASGRGRRAGEASPRPDYRGLWWHSGRQVTVARGRGSGRPASGAWATRWALAGRRGGAQTGERRRKDKGTLVRHVLSQNSSQKYPNLKFGTANLFGF